MKRPPSGRKGHEDYESTDTLPMPVLEDGDTGTLAIPELPHEFHPAAPGPDIGGNTDSFQAPRLAPIAAIPVGASDLAESLREREQRLEEAGRRAAALDAQLQTATRRCEELQQECQRLRDAARVAAPEPAQQSAPGIAAAVEGGGSPPDAVAGVLPELHALRRQNERLQEALSTLHGQMGVREAMLAEAEEALHAALEATHPPAASAAAERPQVPDYKARCDELLAELEAGRGAAQAQAEAQEARLSALRVELEAARAQLQELPASVHQGQRAAQPRPLVTVLRVLVREEDGTEVAYPLGRHTSIGRTPDNDIQVNTSFVSRHHAVVLAGTDHCIVEDLNSTNGLLVNGHRVGRQVLHDGDTVTIGRTHFRYQQRT